MINESNNKIIRDWGNRAAKETNALKKKLKIEHSPGSEWEDIKSKTKSKNGITYRVGMRAPKYAFYVKAGVGRGRKKGSGKENPKDWTDAFYSKAGELADDLMMNTADALQSVTFKF